MPGSPQRSAKTLSPRLSKVLVRRRLLRLLDTGQGGAAVWVSGPPGSGKTTLAADWLRGRARARLWYRVDPDDRDVASVFHRLGSLAPAGGAPLPVFAAAQRADLAPFARRWLRALYARLPPRFALVLDDAHEALGDRGFVALLRHAIEELPRGGRLVVACRVKPPAGLARLVANGALHVLAPEQLDLTRRELAALARLRRAPRRSSTDLRELHLATRGWVAGALLLLESQGTGAAVLEAVEASDPRTLDTYLETEILARVDPGTRAVLFATAFVPDVTPRMARALSGRSAAGDVLARLHRENLFTGAHGHPAPVYRYHPLFQDFLRRRVAQELSAAALRDLQRRTGELLLAEGLLERAMPLLREARAWGPLALGIEGCASSLLRQGRDATLRAWIESIPEQKRRGRPWLRYWLGCARLVTQPGEARAEVEAAFASFDRRGDVEGRLLALSAIVESHFLAASDLSALDPWLDRWLAAFDGTESAQASAEVERHALSSLLRALILRRPAHAGLPALAARVLAFVQDATSAEQRVVLGVDLLLYYSWIGDGHAVAFLMDVIRSARGRAHLDAVHRVNWSLMQAIHECQAGDLDACQTTVEAGVEIARAVGMRHGAARLLAHGAYATLTRGDVRRAGDYLAQIEPELAALAAFDVAHYHHVAAWHALARGELERARSHIERSVEVIQRAGAPFPTALGRFGLAQVLFEQGHRARARECLAAVLQTAIEVRSVVLQFMCQLVRSHFEHEAGESEASLASLREGLAIGRAAGCRNFFGWWRPALMAGRCIAALRHGIEADYVRELVRTFDLAPDETAQGVEGWPFRVEITSLGHFELRIDGAPVAFSRKAQRRPVELLLAVVALGGRDVGVLRLQELLWPDADGDLAQRAFKVTLHRLRRLLGVDDALVLDSGRLRLEPRRVRVDVWALESALSGIEAALAGGDGKARGLEGLARVRAVYRGRFLAEPGGGAALALRDRLHARVLRAVHAVGRALEAARDWEQAAACYEDGLAIDELAEGIYQRLMVCQGELGRRAEALATFRRCEETLRRTLRVPPSPETIRARDALLSGVRVGAAPSRDR